MGWAIRGLIWGATAPSWRRRYLRGTQSQLQPVIWEPHILAGAVLVVCWLWCTSLFFALRAVYVLSAIPSTMILSTGINSMMWMFCSIWLPNVLKFGPPLVFRLHGDLTKASENHTFDILWSHRNIQKPWDQKTVGQNWSLESCPMLPPPYRPPVWIRPEDFAPLALEVANGLSQVVTQSRQRSKKKSEKIAQARSGMIWETPGRWGNMGGGKKSNRNWSLLSS